MKLKALKAETTNSGKPYHFVPEGGSIDTNGRGTLLTTEECPLSPIQMRNPGLSREQQDGRKFNVVELPMLAPVIFRGQRLPASYANFYIANGVVLVPAFNDPNDRIALNILADLFPGREVAASTAATSSGDSARFTASRSISRQSEHH